jgi:hypothetical protein
MGLVVLSLRIVGNLPRVARVDVAAARVQTVSVASPVDVDRPRPLTAPASCP